MPFQLIDEKEKQLTPPAGMRLKKPPSRFMLLPAEEEMAGIEQEREKIRQFGTYDPMKPHGEQAGLGGLGGLGIVAPERPAVAIEPPMQEPTPLGEAQAGLPEPSMTKTSSYISTGPYSGHTKQSIEKMLSSGDTSRLNNIIQRSVSQLNNIAESITTAGDKIKQQRTTLKEDDPIEIADFNGMVESYNASLDKYKSQVNYHNSLIDTLHQREEATKEGARKYVEKHPLAPTKKPPFEFPGLPEKAVAQPVSTSVPETERPSPQGPPPLGEIVPPEKPEAYPALRAGVSPSTWQSIKNVLWEPFAETPEAKEAKALNIYAISKDLDLPMSIVEKNYDSLKRETSLYTDPSLMEIGGGLMILPITAGIASTPVTSLIGLAGYMALSEAENAIVSLSPKIKYQFGAGRGLKDLLPEDANELTKTAVDIFDFLGKGLLVGGVMRRSPKIADKFVKDIVTEYKLPKKMYVEPSKVRNIFGTGKKISPEELDVIKELGLNSKQYAEAVRRGIAIEVPGEVIVTMTDKPFWGKLKSIFNIKPLKDVKTFKMGEFKQTAPIAGLVEGKVSPVPKVELPPERPISPPEAKVAPKPTPETVKAPEVIPEKAVEAEKPPIAPEAVKPTPAMPEEKKPAKPVPEAVPEEPVAEKPEKPLELKHERWASTYHGTKYWNSILPDGKRGGWRYGDHHANGTLFKDLVDELIEFEPDLYYDPVDGGAIYSQHLKNQKTVISAIKKHPEVIQAMARDVIGEEELTETVTKEKVPEKPAKPVPEAEKPAEVYKLKPGEDKFIRGKIEKLGSIEAVNAHYNTDSKVDKYARSVAPEVLGVEKVEVGKVEAVPEKPVEKPKTAKQLREEGKKKFEEGKVKGKEAWEMTQEEYFSEVTAPRFLELQKLEKQKTEALLDLSFEAANQKHLDRTHRELKKITEEKGKLSKPETHKKIIRKALTEGKTPYAGWEKDYPDLAEKYGKVEEKVEPTKAEITIEKIPSSLTKLLSKKEIEFLNTINPGETVVDNSPHKYGDRRGVMWNAIDKNGKRGWGIEKDVVDAENKARRFVGKPVAPVKKAEVAPEKPAEKATTKEVAATPEKSIQTLVDTYFSKKGLDSIKISFTDKDLEKGTAYYQTEKIKGGKINQPKFIKVGLWEGLKNYPDEWIPALAHELAHHEMNLTTGSLQHNKQYVKLSEEIEKRLWDDYKPTKKAPVITGKKGKARTEAGTEIEYDYVVNEASDYVASHDTDLVPNKNYPAEKQPRDRSKIASEVQIRKIEKDLIPERLGENVMASEGAPIVDMAGNIEAGNARTIALQRIYKSGKEGTIQYKQWLIDNADKFGLDPVKIKGMEAPILTRRRLTDVDVKKFVEEANIQATAAMSGAEQAKIDAGKLDTAILEQFVPNERGEINTAANAEFVKSFFGKAVGTTEIGRYVDAKGLITQEGIARVRNAVFAKAFGETSAIERLAESLDSNIKNITNAMLAVSPKLAMLKGQIDKGTRYDFDMSNDIAQAADKLSNLREEGEKLDTYLRQRGLFGEDITSLAKDILGVFDRHKRSSRRLAQIFNEYLNTVDAYGNPKQEGLFEAHGKPTKAELLKAAEETTEEGHAQEDLFKYQVRRGAEGEALAEKGVVETEKVTEILREFENFTAMALDIKVPAGTFELTGVPNRADSRMAVEIGRIFGDEIYFIKSNIPEADVFAGVATAEGKIFLSAQDKGTHHVAVLGHELTHRLSSEEPALHQKLIDILGEEKEAFETFKEKTKYRFFSDWSDARKLEEFAADTVGERMSEPGFWEKLYERSPELVKKIMQYINKVLRNLRIHKEYRTSQHFKDIQKVHDVIDDVMTEYAGRIAERGRRPVTGAGITKAQIRILGEEEAPKRKKIKTKKPTGIPSTEPLSEELRTGKPTRAERIELPEMKALRQKIHAFQHYKGMTNAERQRIVQKITGHLSTTHWEITVEQLQKILDSVKRARPKVIGHKTVITHKTESKIQTLKENLIQSEEMTEDYYSQILKSLRIKQPAYVTKQNFITETQGKEVIKQMLNGATLVKIQTRTKKALEQTPAIKSHIDKIDHHFEKERDIEYPAKLGRTDYFLDMHHVTDKLERKSGVPIGKLWRLLNEKRLFANDLHEKSLTELEQAGGEDYNEIAEDEEAVNRINDYIASRLPEYVKGKPRQPIDITSSEKSIADLMIKRLKEKESDIRYRRFYEWREHGTRIPNAPQTELTKATNILETQGDTALKQWLSGRSWGVIRSGYDIGEVIKPSIKLFKQKPSLPRGHIIPRESTVFQRYERNILQRYASYMKQMTLRTELEPLLRSYQSLWEMNMDKFENPAKINDRLTRNLKEMLGQIGKPTALGAFVMRVYSQAARAIFLSLRMGIRNLFQNVALYTTPEGVLKIQKPTKANMDYFNVFVNQKRALARDWMFLDYKGLPLFGWVNKWADRINVIGNTDYINRLGCYVVKLSEVKAALKKHPGYKTDAKELTALMKKAGFSEFEIMEQKHALEILAESGEEEMAQYIASAMTTKVHFLYERAQRSPEAQGDLLAHILSNLLTFRKGYVQRVLLDVRKLGKDAEIVGGRKRPSRSIIAAVVWAAFVGMVFKKLTGDDKNPYWAINILKDISLGGLATGTQEQIGEFTRNVMEAIQGDVDARGRVINNITRAADMFMPFYDDVINIAEGMSDFKNVDKAILRQLRSAIDDKYKAKPLSYYLVIRSQIEKGQHMLFGTQNMTITEILQKSKTVQFTPEQIANFNSSIDKLVNRGSLTASEGRQYKHKLRGGTGRKPIQSRKVIKR